MSTSKSSTQPTLADAIRLGVIELTAACEREPFPSGQYAMNFASAAAALNAVLPRAEAADALAEAAAKMENWLREMRAPKSSLYEADRAALHTALRRYRGQS